MRRGKTLALQLRYSDPREDPGLEIEELRQVAVEMDRLMTPFRPPFEGLSYINAQAAFVASITPEQQTKMLDGGVPVVELLARQQVLWLQINSTQAYGDAARELRRAMLCCFTQWGRVMVADIAFERIPRYQLYTRFPDPRGNEGSDSIGTPAPKVKLRPRKRAVELTVLREDVAAPASDLRPTWPLELQRADLERFARRLTEAGGPRLEVPAYARRRNLWVASRGTRREVLNALEMLWGVGTLADPQRRVPPGLAEAHARPHTCRTAREARADGASSAAPVDRHHD